MTTPRKHSTPLAAGMVPAGIFLQIPAARLHDTRTRQVVHNLRLRTKKAVHSRRLVAGGFLSGDPGNSNENEWDVTRVKLAY